MNKILLILLYLFLLVLLPLSTIAQDNKELLDHIRQWSPNIEPTPCGDKKRCYCFDLTAKIDSPRSLRYSKCQFCPIEVWEGHILLAFKSWDSDGNKVDEGCFINWKMDGVWKSWHPNGKKATRRNYTNGKQNGHFTVWHDNGRVEVEGRYTEDKGDGEWKYWNRSGELTKKLIWNNGKLLSKEELK